MIDPIRDPKVMMINAFGARPSFVPMTSVIYTKAPVRILSAGFSTRLIGVDRPFVIRCVGGPRRNLCLELEQA